MNFINHFILILLFVIFASCSKEKLNQSVIKEKSLDGQVLEAYSEGLDSLKGCLLYTSPSPRDIGPSRMPSSA